MDSDDEIANYDPTTPYKPAPKSTKPASRTTKPNSRTGAPVAGPSSQPVRVIGVKRKKKSPPSSDDEELYGKGEDEEIVEMRPTAKSSKKESEQLLVNGKASTKGKGKAKAEPTTKTLKATTELIEVEEVDIIDDTEVEALVKPVVRAQSQPSRSKKPVTSKGSEKELARLRQKLSDSEAHVKALSDQLEELFHTRHTAAEESLDHQSMQYEARLSTQEKLIQELTSQLARVEPMARSGKSSLLQFLSRDAADEEQRGLENELSQWKDIAKAKDAVLAEKDKEIIELKRLERDIKHELKAEIERSKSLTQKAPIRNTPGSAARGRGGKMFGGDDPKETAVIKFYEDLTNLLVPGMRFEPGKYLGLDETSFTCIYTYMDLDSNQREDGSGGRQKSLTFTLRFYYDLIIQEGNRTPADEHVTSVDQLVQSIKYTPLELDKETEEFVEKLQFLGDAFTFGREQLALFLKTMYDTLSGAMQSDDSDEMEE